MITHVDAEAAVMNACAGYDVHVEQIDGGGFYPARHAETSIIRVGIRSGVGKEDARRQAMLALDKVLAITGGGVAVVRHTLGPAWAPLPDGQPAYMFVVTVTSRNTE